MQGQSNLLQDWILKFEMRQIYECEGNWLFCANSGTWMWKKPVIYHEKVVKKKSEDEEISFKVKSIASSVIS